MAEGEGRRCEAEELESSSLELLPASRQILQRRRPLGEKDEREWGMPLSPHTIGHTMANQIRFIFYLFFIFERGGKTLMPLI